MALFLCRQQKKLDKSLGMRELSDVLAESRPATAFPNVSPDKLSRPSTTSHGRRLRSSQRSRVTTFDSSMDSLSISPPGRPKLLSTSFDSSMSTDYYENYAFSPEDGNWRDGLDD